MGKVAWEGKTKRNAVDISIELRDIEGGKEVSFVGYVWNNLHTNTITMGQIVDELEKRFASEDPIIKEICRYWRNYNLNGMHAGTRKQEDFLKNNGMEKWGNHYDEACDMLKAANLYNDNGVKFGCSWNFWAIPEQDLKGIENLMERIEKGDK